MNPKYEIRIFTPLNKINAVSSKHNPIIFVVSSMIEYGDPPFVFSYGILSGMSKLKLMSGEDPLIREYKLENAPSFRRIAAKFSKTVLTVASRSAISKNMYSTMILAKLINLKRKDVTRNPIMTDYAFFIPIAPFYKNEKSVE